jgi:hypothetical protein
LALKRKRKVIDTELYQFVDDMLEARTLDTNRCDEKVLARTITDILGEVGVLRSGVDRGKAREMIWDIIKAIVAAAAGSTALHVYHVLSNMNPAAQAIAGDKVREEGWLASRSSVTNATPFFAEPVTPKDLFKLMFHLAGPI